MKMQKKMLTILAGGCDGEVQQGGERPVGQVEGKVVPAHDQKGGGGALDQLAVLPGGHASQHFSYFSHGLFL